MKLEIEIKLDEEQMQALTMLFKSLRKDINENMTRRKKR